MKVNTSHVTRIYLEQSTRQWEIEKRDFVRKVLDRLPRTVPINRLIRALQNKLPREAFEQTIARLVLEGCLPKQALFYLIGVKYSELTDDERRIIGLAIEKYEIPADVISGEAGRHEYSGFNKTRAHEVQRQIVEYAAAMMKDNADLLVSARAHRHSEKGREIYQADKKAELLAIFTDHTPLYPHQNVSKHFVYALERMCFKDFPELSQVFIEILIGIYQKCLKPQKEHKQPKQAVSKFSRDVLRRKASPEESHLNELGILSPFASHSGFKLIDRKPSLAEEKKVRVTVRKYHETRGLKPFPRHMKHYLDAYREMRQSLSLVPFFIAYVFNNFSGSLVFLDRDMRLFYKAARLMARRLGQDSRGIYLVPVSRAMVPAEFAEAFCEEHKPTAIGGLAFDVPSYAYTEGDIPGLASFNAKREQLQAQREKGEYTKTLTEVGRLIDFRMTGKPITDFLNNIGATQTSQLTILDSGVVGTCAAYLKAVLKACHPDIEVATFLFAAANDHPSYLKQLLPNTRLRPDTMIYKYEALPISRRMVTQFKSRNGRSIPEYLPIAEANRTWLEDQPDEIGLGEQLASLALRSLIDKYFPVRPRPSMIAIPWLSKQPGQSPFDLALASGRAYADKLTRLGFKIAA